jgi:hypothetical protein
MLILISEYVCSFRPSGTCQSQSCITIQCCNTSYQQTLVASKKTELHLLLFRANLYKESTPENRNKMTAASSQRFVLSYNKGREITLDAGFSLDEYLQKSSTLFDTMSI